MLKATKNLLKDNLISIALLITILIAVLSLVEISNVAHTSFFNFENSDKIQHLIAYTFLGLSWFFAIKKAKKSFKVRLIIICSCIIYGTVIEVCQMNLTSYRTADYKDIIANSIGVLLAVLVFKRFSHKKEII